MSPLAFLQNPLNWIKAISRYRADTSGAPNFAYDLCVERSTPEERAARPQQLECCGHRLRAGEPANDGAIQRRVRAGRVQA